MWEDQMQIGHADAYEGAVTTPEFRGGGKLFRTLLAGEEGDPGNFRLVYVRVNSKISTPRHRHNFDQLRLALEGAINYGPGQWIEPGELAYFPEGTPYGPEEADNERLGVTIQFGGDSGEGFISEQQMNEGMAALQTRGVFENGIYRRTDNPPEGVRRNQDAFEAIWEEVNGRRITYPEKRWEAPVMMRPQDVAWTQEKPGVARKTIGTFGKRGTEFALLRLEAGAKLDLASRGGARIGFVLSGQGNIDAEELRPHSAFGLKAGEGAGLQARTPLQLMLADMPAFSAASAAAAA
jgi:quercetin dioxygenase-like cupin family protein